MKKKKPTTLPPIHPNLGVERWYKRELMKVINEMRAEVNTLIMDNYKAQSNTVAMDGFSDWLGHSIDYLMDKWNNRLNALSQTVAELFVTKSVHNYDKQLKKHLRKAGFTVRLQMSPYTEEMLKASLGENVGLIKSIGVQYLGKVEQSVWASVKGGFDLGTLAKELQHAYGVTENRAKLIARDQGAKANAVIEMARRKELGITEAIWYHSSAGKTYRKSHVAAHGKRFDIEKGLYLDGKFTLPAQEINCFVGSTELSNTQGVKKLWRRWYRGELSEIVTNSGASLKVTPNHPILTQRGWIPARLINNTDYVVETLDKGLYAAKNNVNCNIPTFSQVFDATSLYIPRNTGGNGTLFKFHGDISDSEVDTINIAGFLPSEINRVVLKHIFELFFTNANHVFISSGLKIDGSLFSALNTLFRAPESIVSGACSVLSFLKGHISHTDDISLRLSSYMSSAISQAISDCSATDIELISKCQFAHSAFVQGDDLLIGELFEGLCFGLWDSNPLSADSLGEQGSIYTNNNTSISNSETILEYKLHRVINNRVFNSSSHIFNLENEKNWYSANSITSHNCRCYSLSIIDGIVS